MIRDLRLTEIMLQALKRDPHLATAEEWEAAGDFAIELRFFPHAFNCYHNALDLSKTQEIAEKLNDILDKITDVLEFLPPDLALHIDEFRFNNPLDPEKWLELSNKLLKQSTEFAKNFQGDAYHSARIALAMTAYCTLRIGENPAPINHVLAQLIDREDAKNFVSVTEELDLSKVNAATANSATNYIRAVVFGDQVALGLQANWELRFEETYAYQWAKQLGAKINLANTSVSGASAMDALLYLKRDVVNYKPDIVFLAFGLNDSWLGHAALLPFEVLMTTVVELLKPITKIVLVGPIPHIPQACPPQERPTQVDLKEVEITAWTNALKRVAKHTGVPFADVEAQFPRDIEERKQYLSNAYNQVNIAGHELIKQAINKVLR